MSHRRFNYGGLILILLGFYFLFNDYLPDLSDLISTYWPLILIIIGLSIILKGKGRHPVTSSDPSDPPNYCSKKGEQTDPYLSNSSVFGDIDLKIRSDKFYGGTINCVFGDINIDLSEIILIDGEQVIKLDGVFGDMHVFLPKGIAVLVSARSVLGDVRVFESMKSGIGQELSYSSPDYSSAGKRLRIHATQVFGDIKIW